MVVQVVVLSVVHPHMLVVLETLLTPIIHNLKDMLVVIVRHHTYLLMLVVAVVEQVE
jgi:hypothetical protein